MSTSAEIEKIARELHEEGYSYSEAYPIKHWKKRGFPEDPGLFMVIDAYLKYLRELEKFTCKTKISAES